MALLSVCFGRQAGITPTAGFGAEPPGEGLLTGGAQFPLMADSTYSTTVPDRRRCDFWMAGLGAEPLPAVPGQERPIELPTINDCKPSASGHRPQ